MQPLGQHAHLRPGNHVVGGKAIITVTVRPVAGGMLTTTASVSGALVDPVPGNNSASATTTVLTNGIDYVETAVSNPPASAPQGGSFGVSDTARNLGSVAAGVSSFTRYYLSLDGVRNTGDLLLTGTPNRGAPCRRRFVHRRGNGHRTVNRKGALLSCWRVPTTRK